MEDETKNESELKRAFNFSPSSKDSKITAKEENLKKYDWRNSSGVLLQKRYQNVLFDSVGASPDKFRLR